MTRHTLDELHFDLADELTLVGVIRLRTDKGDGFTPNLVVTRDRLRPEEALSTYVDRQLIELAKKLRRFVIRTRTTGTVGGVSSFEISCTWQGSQGPIDQLLTVVPRAPPAVLTFTATAPKNQSEAAFRSFRAILATLSFDGSAASADDAPAT